MFLKLFLCVLSFYPIRDSFSLSLVFVLIQLLGICMLECVVCSISEEDTTDGLISYLTLTPLRRSDGGEYVCTGKNEFGHSTRRVRLTSQGKLNYSRL